MRFQFKQPLVIEGIEYPVGVVELNEEQGQKLQNHWYFMANHDNGTITRLADDDRQPSVSPQPAGGNAFPGVRSSKDIVEHYNKQKTALAHRRGAKADEQPEAPGGNVIPGRPTAPEFDQAAVDQASKPQTQPAPQQNVAPAPQASVQDKRRAAQKSDQA